MPSLLPLLDELHRRLAVDKFGNGRIPRFQHFRLAVWLTRQTVESAEGRRDRSIVRLLRKWHAEGRPQLDTSAAATVDAGVPWWARLLAAIFLAWHRPIRCWIWARGLPLIGREPRWFMKQPFMVPRHSTSFYGFAERLTLGQRSDENPEQIQRLLVHSFLQDLRIAYLPRRLRIRRWRRTAYVVVLLDNITEANGGWGLLRLINDVRNERGDLDPLLVVTCGQTRPPWSPADIEFPPVSEIDTELRRWYERLPGQRQKLESAARFIVLQLSESTPDAEQHPHTSDADQGAWPAIVAIRPRKPPLLARLTVAPLAVMALVAAPAIVGGSWVVERWTHSCLPDGSEGVAAFWHEGIGQCVGYSDDNDLVFGPDKRLTGAQVAVFEQNREAVRLHEIQPTRPLVSVIYFSGLTHPEADPGTDHSVAEELEGLLIKQQQSNRADGSSPFLRVIIANGGNRMDAAPEVVQQMIAKLVRDDPTVLGVIGMDRTVPATERAIIMLGDLGVPVIATTLSGEGLRSLSPLFFQMVPGNRVQAQLLDKYAKSTGRSVSIYHPPPDDDYIDTLVTEARKLPGAVDVEWIHNPTEIQVECGQDKIAFYAGREDKFGAFLAHVISTCELNRLPKVVGDDAVIRFIAQLSARDRDEFNQVPVSWVDMGSLIALAGKSCRDEGNPAISDTSNALRTFCAGYERLNHEDDETMPAAREYARIVNSGQRLPWPGQGVGLSYDAAGLFVEAVSQNQRRPGHVGAEYVPHRGAIAQELREIEEFDGATGIVTFRSDRFGENRNLAILTIDDIHDSTEEPDCEEIIGHIYSTDPNVTPMCPT